MTGSECYVAVLYAGIPLLILTWLGQLCIYIIYKAFNHYIKQPYKYYHQHEEFKVLDKHVELVEDSDNSSDSSAEDSPPILESKDSPDGQLTHEGSHVIHASETPKSVQEPVPIDVQQQLAGRNLNMSNIQESMAALAPLAKQRVEESNLPVTQKELLLRIMSSMNNTNSMNTTDALKILSSMYGAQVAPASNNILDD